MELIRYLNAYFAFSVLGWIWESIYCTIDQRKWQNRGFLYGPLCPIYGFGSILGLIFYDLISMGKISHLSWWQIFIMGFVASMVLEYPTSYVLEKLFHARWWDYSDMPLNINGRTCAITSVGFGIGAIIIMEFFIPLFEKIYVTIPNNFAIALAVVLLAIHSSDFTLTVSGLTNFQRNIAELEEEFQDRMTLTVDKIFERHSRLYGRTFSRIASFRMGESRNMIADKLVKIRRDLKKKK